MSEKIILLNDIIENKVRKEKELEFYQNQLEELQKKMYWVQRDIDLTNTIISIIENEMVISLAEPAVKSIENKNDEHDS